jgi:hypothetical protein
MRAWTKVAARKFEAQRMVKKCPRADPWTIQIGGNPFMDMRRQRFFDNKERLTSILLGTLLALVAALAGHPAFCQGQEPEASYRNRSISQWIAALQTSDARSRAEAAYALGQIGAKAVRAVPILVGVAEKDADNFVRSEAVLALGTMGAPARSAMPSVIQLLKNDPIAGVRGAAATALGGMCSDSGRLVPVLVAVLRGDKSAYVRGCAALALGRLEAGAQEALPQLREAALNDPSPVVRRRADEAIQRIEIVR